MTGTFRGPYNFER